MSDYIIKVIPGKYLLIINGKLMSLNSPYEVSRAIIVDYHRMQFNEDVSHYKDEDDRKELLEEMITNLSCDKLIMLPLGEWKITNEELLKWFNKYS